MLNWTSTTECNGNNTVYNVTLFPCSAMNVARMSERLNLDKGMLIANVFIPMEGALRIVFYC